MKLLCIDDRFTYSQKRLMGDWPKVGEIYSLRGVREFEDSENGRVVVGYHLEEIINVRSVGSPLYEPYFRDRRFVILEEDDIAMELEIMESIGADN